MVNKNLSASYLKVGYESMHVIRFRTTKKGNSTTLLYIFCMSEPLGTELNTVACSFTRDLIFIEVYIGKEGMKHSKYQQQLGTTTACNKRMTEKAKGIC